MKPGEADGAWREHSGAVWGLAYRMLGVAADADEITQDTFERALRSAPELDRSPRPWLLRVAANLARDRLRSRRRRSYIGPWLPAPADVDALPDPALGPEARVSAREAGSYAFLLALEALTPNQRAVLLLRDVLGWSVAETAAALDLTPSNTKTTHHRARRAMADYEARKRPLDSEQQQRMTQALMAFAMALSSPDENALQALFTREAKLLSDGGGRFFAARKPVFGARRIGRMYWKLARRKDDRPAPDVQLATLNGAPALVARLSGQPADEADRWVLRLECDEHGAITELHSILAPGKLTAVFPP